MSEKNSCYTYFAIKGIFNTDDISKKLGLTPTKQWNAGDIRKNGTAYEFSLWEYGFCDEYDIETANQMRKTIKELIPLTEKLKEIKREYDVDMVLEIVPTVCHDPVTPMLAPTQDIIKFLYETGTDLDIDLYVG